MHLESVQDNSPNYVTMTSSIDHLHHLLNHYQSKLNDAVEAAENQSIIEKGNIHNYEFDRKKLKPKMLSFKNGASIQVQQSLIKIKSQIDFINVSFNTTKATQRSYIKKFLTEKIGKKHFITEEHSHNATVNTDSLASCMFNIRIHDVNNKKCIHKIVHALKKNYGAYNFRITCIELAHDFYNAPPEFLTALFKSIQFDADVQNIRVFRLKGENQTIPYEPIRLKNLLLQGFNIGVNDYRKDDVYYHFYFKKTDHNKCPLPHEEWRLRAEVRLSNLNHALEDLRNVVKTGFKKLTFTQLTDTATLEQRKLYSLYIRPYGQKLSLPILKNGHYRDFKKFICTHQNLNERLRESVKNLSNKF